MYRRFVNWFSATRVGSATVKHVAARVDPVLFRWSRGRFMSTGKPTLPMLTLSAVGRRSGQVRQTQLAYHPDGDDWLVVASAMGQEQHPAWRHNLEANPDATVLTREGSFRVSAELLSADEKANRWDEIARSIPQLHVYRRRTERDIGVFRLRRVGPA